MNKRNYVIYMLALLGLFITLTIAGTAGAKSLYMCADHNSAQFDAWNINPNGTLTYQATYNLVWAYDPAGIDIDESSNSLFVTTEYSSYSVTFEYVNATVMTSEGYTSEGHDFAGIAVDDENDIIYTIYRMTNQLYAYDWHPEVPNATLRAGFPKALPNCSEGMGIALDEYNDILWVADADDGVARAYNTNTWLEDESLSFTPIHQPVDICVDRVRQIVYTVSMDAGAWTPSGCGSLYISKFDLGTRIETTGTLIDQGVGCAVDEASGYVYITVSGYDTPPNYYDGDIQVWNCNVNPFTMIEKHDLTGSPAGICIPQAEVSYNPLGFGKDDQLTEGGCVTPDGTFTYQLSYSNLIYEIDIHNVIITDTLPAELDYISSTGGGTYDVGTRTVTWNIGTLTAGQTEQSVTLTVHVKSGTTPGSTIINSATIDSDETTPTTQSETTPVCEGGGGDITPPTQDIVLGMPKDEDVYYIDDEWLDRIGPNTPVWVNSTDSESGSHNMTITIYWSIEFGVWTLIDTYYIEDNDAMDTDPTVGSISVLLYMNETCFHEIHAFCYDNAGNEDTDRLDFIVDASPPISDSEYIGPLIIKNSVHYIANTTIKRIWAYDEGCIGGTGVCGVFWRVHDTDLNVIGEGTVYDGDTYTFDNGKVLVTGDHDPAEGNITIELSVLEDCIHYIYHKAIDCLGNEEERVKQMVKVDTKPPILIKKVGLPNCDLLNGSFCITKDTPIWINVTDDPSNYPCVVESVHLKLVYMYKDEIIVEWHNITSGTINHTFTFDELEMGDDCIHYLCIWAEDDLGNTIGWHNESFYIDTMAPWINKTIGDPKLPYEIIGIPNYPNYWVNCQTPITIDAWDMGCCNQLAEVYYQINQSEWIPIPLSSLPFTFSFEEDCQHDLDIKAIDCLGNTAYHNETFYVDCTPPEIIKTVGDPNCTIIPGAEYCVTTQTPINIGAIDHGCQGGVGLKEVKYRIWNATHGWGPWMYDTDLMGDQYFFTEECTHYLHIIATDLMDNYIEDNETFHVDETYPIIDKVIGDPNCTGDFDVDYCITTETPITINVDDLGCCDSFTVKIQYGNETWNSGWIDITTQLPDYNFQFNEECWHYLHIWAYDCLGHETHDNETFNVDDSPPEIIKIVGDPNCTCPDAPGDYCVTTQTPIYLDAIEQGCCNSEGIWLEYRIWYDGTWGPWTTYVEPFTFTEECKHYLETRAWDCLNNTAYDNETFYVDETPPIIHKTVGDPNCDCGLPEGDFCVNLSTEITITATDTCCPCGIIDIYYRIYFNEQWTDWIPYVTPITFNEECMHILEIKATDCLNNTAYDTETFYVDETPPELIKKVGEPNFTKDNKTWWVTTETEINLTAIEHGCCPCPWTEITYRYWYQGIWTDWIIYTGNFTFTQGCTHYLEVKVKDCLGNYIIDNETFIVHGPSGPSGPTIEIVYPVHGETYDQQVMEVSIYAHDGQTSWENLEIDLWQPGGRRDAPTLWYDVILGDTQDYYKAYIDLFCYQDGATLTLWASAIDEDGNVQFALPVTFTVHTTTIWDQWMQPGWNLLILPPNIGCDPAIERIMYSINGSYDFIFHLDAMEGWISYWTEDTNNELTEIEGGKQYWVHISDTQGLRYYLALTEIEIQTPENNAIVTDLPEINGITWNSQIGITDVYIQLYYKDGTNQKHYWNGSAWVSIAVNLDCMTDMNYPMGWSYDSSAISWTTGQTYYIKAVATDEGGCTAVDMVTFSIAGECVPEKTYTINADFDEGILNGVEYDTVPNQLQLIPGQVTTYPTLWIANAGEDSLSKWDTSTNKEVARYHTWFGPLGSHGAWAGAAPSRTCVDSNGNCYVANRDFDYNTPDVFKVLTDDWIDRNNNGVMDTSYDANNDSMIQPSEMLPMTDSNSNGIIDDEEIVDERIAWAVQVGSGGLGRSLAIGLDGNIWLGLYNSQQYYKIDSDDGSILGGPYSVSGHSPYGALVDKYGVLWGSNGGSNIIKMNTSNPAEYTVYSVPGIYGIAIGYDSLGNTLVYCGYNYPYVVFNSSTNTYSYPVDSFDSTLGIAVDSQGNIVVGSYYDGDVAKYAPDNTIIWQVTGQLDSEVRGIVVDSNDDIWAIHLYDNKMCKYNGTDGAYLGIFDTGLAPYTYSDATGIGFASSITSGTWKVTFDSLQTNTIFDTISWTSYEPDNSSITVRVRSSNDQITWSSWETATNGVSLSTTPAGQYLAIEVSFKMIATDIPPILYDLTVTAICGNV